MSLFAELNDIRRKDGNALFYATSLVLFLLLPAALIEEAFRFGWALGCKLVGDR